MPEPVIYGQSCCTCERRTRRLETGVDFPVSLLPPVTLERENYEPVGRSHIIISARSLSRAFLLISGKKSEHLFNK